jgi:intracellular sulfur oxidation DsrE/DsrF family protein
MNMRLTRFPNASTFEKNLFMENNSQNNSNPRRQFLGKIATGVAAIGLSSIAPISAYAENVATPLEDVEEWFKKIKGKHRIVFDATQPNGVFPFAWPKVFLLTNAKTGTPEKDCSVVVVLRHSAIGYAMQDNIWAKYGIGELFQAEDPKTGKASTRNPFWKPKPGDFKLPAVGEVQIGINELQDSGVMFCVCDMALTVYSGAVADKMKMDPAEIKKEWVAALLPGIQVVPSGVWAVNRAQERGCSYCFAG